MTTFAYTSDFREEFEAETASLLRRRFMYFIWGNFALYIITHFSVAAIRALVVALSGDPEGRVAERLQHVLLRNYGGWPGLVAVFVLTIINIGLVVTCT